MQMLARLLFAAFAGPLASHALAQAQDPPFTEQDLVRLASELGSVTPANPHYQYPIQARLVESPAVNAQTYVLERDGKLVPQLELMTGLVERAHGDPRLLRAVLAHELAHLSLGHALEGTTFQDLSIAHTRQQEFEADAAGVSYLLALGYERKDMLDVLTLLDRVLKDGHCAWMEAVTGDHASPITRAARLAPDDEVLAAITRFELGLACMECRHYEQALAWFDEAQSFAKQWAFFEAAADAASAALQDYYDRLPAAVQDAWLRPEFGPHLTDTILLRGRAIAITDQDLQRHEEALRRIEKMVGVFSSPMKTFLMATANVLDPRGDEARIRQGVADLQRVLDGNALLGWDKEMLRLRVANNLALGLERLGERERAAKVLLAEQVRDSNHVLLSVAENLARLPMEKLSANEALVAARALFTFLTWTPVDAPGGKKAERAFERLKKEHSLQVNAQLTRSPVALCGAASISIHGKQIGLFESFAKISESMGAIPAAGFPNARLPALRYLIWGDGDVVALAEGERLLKITTYTPDAYVELLPRRESGLRTSYVVRIGMTQTELAQLLSPAGGDGALQPQPASLLDRRALTPPAETGANAGLAQEESWLFYPSLSLGVLIENGKINGLSVTPAAL